MISSESDPPYLDFETSFDVKLKLLFIANKFSEQLKQNQIQKTIQKFFLMILHHISLLLS